MRLVGEAGCRGGHGDRLARGQRPPVAVTDERFGTHNDADNGAAVRAVPPDDLSLAGLAVHDRRATVDKVLKHLRLHP